jgi:mRNA interferase RelE/StbE
MYKVVFGKSAKKDLEKVNTIYLDPINSHIEKLSENPRPFGYIKLSGFEDLYRIRVGIYRIIYSIEDDILTVEVIKIDHRSNVYK